MKFLLLLILFVFQRHSDPDIKEVRNLFYQAMESSRDAAVLQNKLKSVNELQPLLLGYKGMAEMVLAKHSYNPYSKISFFKKGKLLLEKAIELVPQNSELRYLRFSVQTNAPIFLKYRRNIEEDKSMILNYLLQNQAVDADLGQRMRAFIQESRYFSNQEKNLIKDGS